MSKQAEAGLRINDNLRRSAAGDFVELPAEAGALSALLQGLDQEKDFRGHRVVQIRGVGEGAVAAAGKPAEAASLLKKEAADYEAGGFGGFIQALQAIAAGSRTAPLPTPRIWTTRWPRKSFS